MRAKKTHVIVLIVSVIMLFGSMGIAVFAADETASDNSAATTEQIVQDEVQPDAVDQETAPIDAEGEATASKSKAADGVATAAKASKGASLGEMKATESVKTATGSPICVITFDSNRGPEYQYSVHLSEKVALRDLIVAVGIEDDAIRGDKTYVTNGDRLSVIEESNTYYVRALGDWTNGKEETIYLCNSAGTTVAAITAKASIVSENVGKDIKAPVAKEGLKYKKDSPQVLIKAGSTPVGKMQYTLSNPKTAGTVWYDDVNYITGTDAKSYPVYWRVVSGKNECVVISDSIEAAIDKADPKVIPPKPMKPTPVYDGTAKQIATEGSTTAGTMKYYVGDVPPEKDADWYFGLEKDNCKRTQAGKYKVWFKVVCDAEESLNYNSTAPKFIEAKIEGKEVVVSVKVDDKVYDGQVIQPGAVSFTYNGETKADPPEEVDVSVTFYEDPLHLFKTTKSDGIIGANGSAPSNEGTYYVEAKATPEKPSGNFEYKSAKDQKFTISPLTVTLEWTSKTFVYNGKEHAPKAVVTNCVGTEEITAVVSGAEKDAGEYTATVKKLESADGDTLASNYVLPKDSSASTDYTITPKPVTVIWTNDDGCKDIHILNGSKHKVKAAIVGAVNGEELLPKYAPNSVIEAKAAGTYKGIVNGVLIKKLIIIKTETFNYQLVDADGKDISESTYPWMISNPEDDPVADVIALIKALDPNAADYAAKAWIVVDAFNALSKDQKADSRFREQEVATKLAGAQYEVAEEADQKAAKPVMDQIDALTGNSTKAEVEAARAAYNALSYAQKAACGQSRSFTLQSQEYRIYSGEAKVKKVNGYKVKNVKGKKARATWKATAGVDGYKITYKAKGMKAKTVYANASATKKTLTKLKKNKKYTVKIRSFNLVYNPLSGTDEKVFGKTSTKKVKIKK